jgi:hypothetical protein
LAVLFLPLVSADPEIRDASEATVFVDGDSDFFEFAYGYSLSPGTGWTIVGPAGGQLALQQPNPQRPSSLAPERWRLDGTQLAGASSWIAAGNLDGEPADGTWTLIATGLYDSYDAGPSGWTHPGATLSIQGKAIHFGTRYVSAGSEVQLWNWHQTTGTWNEPSTVPNPPNPALTDQPDESPEEDPQFARFFASTSGPVRQSISGVSESQTVPGQDVDTPPFTIPATCTVAQCHVETPLVDTPPVTAPATCTAGPCNAETPLVTPAEPVPRTCAPLEVICFGPFTVPSQDLGDVPAICDALEPVCIGPITIPAQDTGNAPAVCDAAGELCVGPIPVPAQDVVETQPVTVSVDFTGLDLLADPHAAELTSIGPFHEVIPVPGIGDVPVEVCAATCPFPVSPEGESAGSLTITVTVSAEQRNLTVPLDSSL